MLKHAACSAISASCETFAALLCDVAHVGFGTYPYDATVSTFGEKLLILLWRMQQSAAGIQYIGLRTSMLTGGNNVLFGCLPETAPTSVDELRRQRREKRPDLALQLLGRKMGNALPHERHLWAKASSPRSPGLGPKSSRRSKSNQHHGFASSPRETGTFGTSPRQSDYGARVQQKRLRQQMSLQQAWDGKEKR
jgi:hypothetical protein